MKDKTKIIVSAIAVVCCIVIGIFILTSDGDSGNTDKPTTEAVSDTQGSEEEETDSSEDSSEDTTEDSGITIEDSDPDGGEWTPIK